MTVGICVVCQQEDAWATVGAVCERCWGRTAAALRAIPRLLVDLAGLGYVERDGRAPRICYPPQHDLAGERVPHFDPVANMLTAGPLGGSKGAPKVSGTAEAPVPVRLDAVDLTAAARPASTAVKLRGAWAAKGGDPDQIGHLSVATELDGYARMWAADRGEHGPDPQVPLLCSWLLDRLDWACSYFPAVDEFAATVGRLYGTLTAATGGFPARPEALTARCPSCGSMGLYRDVDIERVACGCCPVLLTDDDYAEYARQLIEEAA